jgi:hypothetical protein
LVKCSQSLWLFVIVIRISIPAVTAGIRGIIVGARAVVITGETEAVAVRRGRLAVKLIKVDVEARHRAPEVPPPCRQHACLNCLPGFQGELSRSGPPAEHPPTTPLTRARFLMASSGSMACPARISSPSLEDQTTQQYK